MASLLDLRADVSDIPSGLARLQQSQAEELSTTGAEHVRTISMRDAEIDRLRKELQHERRGFKRKRADTDDMRQHRVMKVENGIKSVFAATRSRQSSSCCG